jgi:endonuclease YncB( thermonuclease family)
MTVRTKKFLFLTTLILGLYVANRFLLTKPVANTVKSDSYKVLEVYDGDTIQVQTENGPEKVRFSGINAPETTKPGVVGMCMADEATKRTRELIGSSKRVILTPDSRQTNRDRYNRLLRYVSNDQNQDINLMLVQEGLAPVMKGFEAEKKTAYLKAEAEAKRQGLGVWSEACKNFKP